MSEPIKQPQHSNNNPTPAPQAQSPQPKATWPKNTVRNFLYVISLMGLVSLLFWLITPPSQTVLTAQAVTPTPAGGWEAPIYTVIPTQTVTPKVTSTPVVVIGTVIIPIPPTSLPNTPTPKPILTAMSDKPFLSSDLLSSIDPNGNLNIWVESWSISNTLILGVTSQPNNLYLELSKKVESLPFSELTSDQVEIQNLPDYSEIKLSEIEIEKTELQKIVHQLGQSMNHGLFSPNKQWAAWGQRYMMGHDTLYIKQLQSDSPPISLLSDDIRQCEFFWWSPTSTKIAFQASTINYVDEIQISSLTGQQIGMVKVTTGRVGDVVWSPNEEYLAFEMQPEPQSDLNQIYLVKSDGTGLTQLTEHGLVGGNLHWSFDSKTITYSYNSQNGRQIPWLVTIGQ